MQSKLLVALFAALALTACQKAEEAAAPAMEESAENVSAESSRKDFYNSDEYLYSPNSGRCTSASVEEAMAEQQERSPSSRTLATLKKCEYYGKLDAQKNPPKKGMFSQ